MDAKNLSFSSLRWCHNGHDSVSNHQPHDCLLKRLFRRRSTKTSKLRSTGLCAGNSLGTGEFPTQMASNAKNVSIWWRHHVVVKVSVQLIPQNEPRCTGYWQEAQNTRQTQFMIKIGRCNTEKKKWKKNHILKQKLYLNKINLITWDDHLQMIDWYTFKAYSNHMDWWQK